MIRKYRDGADELADIIFDMVRDDEDDQVVIDEIAEKLREVARGNLDIRDWNL